MPYDYGAPPDIEDAVVARLATLGTASVERPAGDVLPFYMVTRVDGDDDKIWDYPVVDVDCFAADRNAANVAAWQGHRHLICLLPGDQIALPDGRKAVFDRIETEHGPKYVDYGIDSMQRYVSRYMIQTRFDRDGGS